MTQWYYRRYGRSHGPFSPKQFKQLATSGHIQPTDEIRKDDMPNWVPGTKIEGLFPRLPVRPPEEPEPELAGQGEARHFLPKAAGALLVGAALGAAALALGWAFVWRH
jgi:hypothetical protein